MSSAALILRDDISKRVLLQQLNAQLPNYTIALDINADDLAQGRLRLVRLQP